MEGEASTPASEVAALPGAASMPGDARDACEDSMHAHRPQSRLFFHENCGCGICYETVQAAEDAIPMFCCHHLHIVHLHCLVKWCVQKRLENQESACPFCRKLLFTPAAFDDVYAWHMYKENESVQVDAGRADNVSGMLSGHVSRRILAHFPVNNTPITELRLVRLTLFSYFTMLINIMLLCVIFVFFIRNYSAYTGGGNGYTNAYAKPGVTRPPPPPRDGPSTGSSTGPNTKHGIPDIDRDLAAWRASDAWVRAMAAQRPIVFIDKERKESKA